MCLSACSWKLAGLRAAEGGTARESQKSQQFELDLLSHQEDSTAQDKSEHSLLENSLSNGKKLLCFPDLGPVTIWIRSIMKGSELCSKPANLNANCTP